MYSELLSQVHTKEDKELILTEVELLLESVYKTGEASFEQALQSRVRKKTADLIRIAAADSQRSREDYLQGLKLELEKLQTMILTLAFEPSEKLVSQIAGWIRENVAAGIILDLVYDASIIGGAVVIFAGHYADFSLAKSLREILKGSDYLKFDGQQ